MTKKKPKLRVVAGPKAKAPGRSASDLVSSAHGTDSLRERLAPFLANNPEADYTRSQPRKAATIDRPWGDASLSVRVEPSDQELVAALNAVRLPPRFTALLHKDSGRLEFIYTAFPIDPETRARRFEFFFEGSKGPIKCWFGDASERLHAIAQATVFTTPPGPTQHRNLASFRLWWHYKGEHAAQVEGTPTSFWVENAPVDENALAALASHLNFYMFYYDQRTPFVLLHDEPAAPQLVGETRHPHGEFPARIDGKQIDPYLLLVWQSLMQAPDPFRRFLYAYQVLEFRTFYYVQEKTLQNLKRIFAAPDFVGRIDQATRQIFDAVTDIRRNEDAKFDAMVKECVSPDAVWAQILPNVDFFTRSTSFDGGFVLEPLLSSPTQQAFNELWSAGKFQAAIRNLRNALVHGREPRQNYAIAPTRSNHERIRPWLGPIVVTAQEALVFGC